MKKFILGLFLVLSICSNNFAQTTIQQKILLVRNDGIIGGQFQVVFQIKGTGLPTALTLGTLTTDIQYDATKLSYSSGSNWNTNIGFANGYTNFTQSNGSGNTREVRVGILGTNVNISGGGIPPGYDMLTTYDNIVRINFIILDNSQSVSLTIVPSTNQIGLFEYLHNEPWGLILDQVLSSPENLGETPLPIELQSFTSSVTKNNIQLHWKTVKETNNKEFIVERKSLNTETWSNTATIEGKGNTNTITEYSFSDNNLQTGKYNYRLKQVDYNGNYEYHNLNGVVEVGVPDKFELSQNYPNPFNPTTKIDFDLPFDCKVHIILYDITGREVKTLVNDTKTAGYYTININASDLSSGVYFYRIITKSAGKDFVMTKKMALIK